VGIFCLFAHYAGCKGTMHTGGCARSSCGLVGTSTEASSCFFPDDEGILFVAIFTIINLVSLSSFELISLWASSNIGLALWVGWWLTFGMLSLCGCQSCLSLDLAVWWPSGKKLQPLRFVFWESWLLSWSWREEYITNFSSFGHCLLSHINLPVQCIKVRMANWASILDVFHLGIPECICCLETGGRFEPFWWLFHVWPQGSISSKGVVLQSSHARANLPNLDI